MLPLLVALGLIGFGCSAQEPAMTLTAAAPCNVFLVGEELAFTRTGTAPLTCVVQDYDAREVWRGDVTAEQFTIPAQPPGYYEVHWQAGEAKGVTPFGVVSARPDEPPPSGPVAVDGATAWLSQPDQWEPLAKMLRRIGIGWMRERISWGQVNPEPGKLDWDRYETVAEALHKQGIREYQIFHDSPDWTHPGKKTRCPDDLREVYRFTKEASAHFAGRILAWEPWNEPDIDFFDQLGDKYAGIQKAAYLGAKAGDPKASVLSCSFCRGRSGFSDNVFESGIADYVDIFNFHTYAPISQYVDNLAAWTKLPVEYGIPRRPIWLTEAGIRLVAADSQTLTPEQERTQAEFVPRSFAISLAAGVDRHFFFVLPFYPENGVQFGALHKDASPRPALLAIATAARQLGEGRYLGKLACEPDTVQAYAFDSGSGSVVVVWADEPTEATLSTGMRSVYAIDAVGRERQVQTDGGTLHLSVGPLAQYVTGLGDVSAQASGQVRPPGKLPKLDPSKVVLVGYIDAGTVDKGSNCHIIRADEPAPFVVDVYNLDEAKPAKGRVTLALPDGWTADRTEAEVSLPPMGRKSLRVHLQPGPTGLAKGTIKIRVEGDFPGPKTAPSVSYVRLDIATVQPKERLSLNLDRVEAWEANIPRYGKMKIEPGPDGGVAFPITFTGPGDRWCYPRARFVGAQDWRQYQAIAFEYRFDTDDDSTSARVQVIETGGSSYICSVHPATKDWRRAVALFADLDYGSWSPKDADGTLDLDQIGEILIGCNTQKLEKLTLEVRNVELLAFR
ncbi:MAG: hypothetical protein FJX75_07550 [Armatimonadetes bacterium]|nr:hypothetical protein [Armatimonadota bacterium]